MPRSRRNPPAGYIYHVLNRANRRQTLFECTSDFEAMIAVVLETCLLHPLRILDYCLMPNHWHFVMWPCEDDQLAAFMHHLTTTHATRWNRAHRVSGTGHVYRGPYYDAFVSVLDETWLRVPLLPAPDRPARLSAGRFCW